jgi:DNA modification methylase
MKLLLGDCLDKLKELEANSVDSIVTDPPYGLAFMGKKWDYDVPSQAIWEECMRVLKPGGHILSFAGSRTYHRMAVRIEDAGFEIRDQIMWIYGSGFPKSHNIGKAFDKRGGNNHLVSEVAEKLKEARESRGVSKAEADKLFCDGTTNYQWFEGRKDGVRLPDDNSFDKICNEWGELKPYQDLIKSANREVVGKYEGDVGGLGGERLGEKGGDITIASTDVAKQWEGWGTALKPAHEPIVMARKPLVGTVADNVLEYGVGGLNIDGCRVGTDGGTKRDGQSDKVTKTNPNLKPTNSLNRTGHGIIELNEGRFPANIIFECTCENPKVVADKYDIRAYNDYKNTFKSYEENNSVTGEYQIKDVETTKVIHTDPNCPCYILDQQSGKSKSSSNKWEGDNNAAIYGKYQKGVRQSTFSDYGGASRFFYCPKASKKDRDEGMPESVPQFTGRPRRKDGSVIYKETHAEEWAEAMAKKERKDKTSLAGAEEKLQQLNGAKVIKGRDAGQDSRSVAHKARPTARMNIHPTVKPTELMKYLIRLVTPKGGVVLDPFMGSGSTGKAAVIEGMEFIGIEREEEYYEIAKQRIEHETNKRKFF